MEPHTEHLGEGRRRLLSPAPDRIVGADGVPVFGSYEGPLPRVDLVDRIAAGRFQRVTQAKRWLYLLVVKDPFVIGLCVLRTGYAAKGFAFVSDGKERRMLADVSRTAPPFAGTVGDGPLEPAAFRGGGLSMAFGRPGSRANSSVAITIEHPTLSASFSIATAGAPPAISAIAKLGNDRVTATEKRALLAVQASAPLVAGGRSIDLDGAWAAYDYSQGLLPRRTRWRWAMGIGTRDGKPFAINLTDGFVGEAECAFFEPSRVVPLAEPSIRAPEGVADGGHDDERWPITSSEVDLSCRLAGVHRERENFGIVRSRFVQAACAFEGTVRVDGKSSTVNALGVVEDQDVTW